MRRLTPLFCLAALAAAAQMPAHSAEPLPLPPVRVGPQEPALQNVPPPRVDPAAGPVTTEWIAVGGRQRSHILAEPKVPAPHPTLIALHGAGGSAAAIAIELGPGAVCAAARFCRRLPAGAGGSMEFLGCGESPPDSLLPRQGFHDIQLELSSQCAGGPVALYRVMGGGHAVPANAGHLLLDFFRDQAR